MERLDKLLGATGKWSRKEAKALIKAGRVRVEDRLPKGPEDKVEEGSLVTVDGKPITRYIVRDAWEEAESGWYYNLSDRTIWLKTPKPKKNDFDIVISTEKFDLIGMAED